MEAFKTLTSNAYPLLLSDIDTDMIIPAEFLTQTTKEGYGKSLFFRLKEKDKDFVFNMPEYQGAKILIAGDNFGCGSSREHAVWALKQAGIKVIIAPSFSDIFFNNSAKNGLLLIELDKDIVKELGAKVENADFKINIDLENQKVSTVDNEYSFEYDQFRKTCLLEGLDDINYLLSLKDEINKYIKNRSF